MITSNHITMPVPPATFLAPRRPRRERIDLAAIARELSEQAHSAERRAALQAIAFHVLAARQRDRRPTRQQGRRGR